MTSSVEICGQNSTNSSAAISAELSESPQIVPDHSKKPPESWTFLEFEKQFRGHFLEFLRNLTPQVLTVTVAYLTQVRLNCESETAEAWLLNAVFFVCMLSFIYSAFANGIEFFSKSRVYSFVRGANARSWSAFLVPANSARDWVKNTLSDAYIYLRVGLLVIMIVLIQFTPAWVTWYGVKVLGETASVLACKNSQTTNDGKSKSR